MARLNLSAHGGGEGHHVNALFAFEKSLAKQRSHLISLIVGIFIMTVFFVSDFQAYQVDRTFGVVRMIVRAAIVLGMALVATCLRLGRLSSPVANMVKAQLEKHSLLSAHFKDLGGDDTEDEVIPAWQKTAAKYIVSSSVALEAKVAAKKGSIQSTTASSLYSQIPLLPSGLGIVFLVTGESSFAYGSSLKSFLRTLTSTQSDRVAEIAKEIPRQDGLAKDTAAMTDEKATAKDKPQGVHVTRRSFAPIAPDSASNKQTDRARLASVTAFSGTTYSDSGRHPTVLREVPQIGDELGSSPRLESLGGDSNDANSTQSPGNLLPPSQQVVSKEKDSLATNDQDVVQLVGLPTAAQHSHSLLELNHPHAPDQRMEKQHGVLSPAAGRSHSSQQMRSISAAGTVKTEYASAEVVAARGWASLNDVCLRSRLAIWVFSPAYSNTVATLCVFVMAQQILSSTALFGWVFGVESDSTSNIATVSAIFATGITISWVFSVSWRVVLMIWVFTVTSYIGLGFLSPNAGDMLGFTQVVCLLVVAVMTTWSQFVHHASEAAIFQIRQKEKQSVGSSFLRYLFHEVRVPLSSVSASVDALRVSAMELLDESDQESLAVARFSLDMVSDLLDNCLDLQKISDGELQISKGEVDPEELICQCGRMMRPFATSKGCEIVLLPGVKTTLPSASRLENDPPSIPGSDYKKYVTAGDLNRLMQVMNNLTSNACKYGANHTVELSFSIENIHDVPECVLPTQASIKRMTLSFQALARESRMSNVSTSDFLSRPPSRFSRDSPNSCVSNHISKHSNINSPDSTSSEEFFSVILFKVRDYGQGMSSKDIESTFQPFKRLQRHEGIKGSGLGLAICKALVEMHGGMIGVDSCQGEGSMFMFWIPLLDPPQRPRTNLSQALSRASEKSLNEAQNGLGRPQIFHDEVDRSSPFMALHEYSYNDSTRPLKDEEPAGTSYVHQTGEIDMTRFERGSRALLSPFAFSQSQSNASCAGKSQVSGTDSISQSGIARRRHRVVTEQAFSVAKRPVSRTSGNSLPPNLDLVGGRVLPQPFEQTSKSSLKSVNKDDQNKLLVEAEAALISSNSNGSQAHDRTSPFPEVLLKEQNNIEVDLGESPTNRSISSQIAENQLQSGPAMITRVGSSRAGGRLSFALKKTVLIVEDDSIVRASLKNLLGKKLGFEDSVACDGQEACSIFEQRAKQLSGNCGTSEISTVIDAHAHGSQAFDLILIDYEMPKLNGKEAIARIREIERTYNIAPSPAIGLTGHACEADHTAFMDAGCDTIMAKPIRLESFLSLLLSKFADSMTSKAKIVHEQLNKKRG